MSNKEYYKDKIIWITGASSGIGEALTKKLASWDATLIISSNRPDELERVRKECGAKEEKVVILPIDLSIPDQVDKTAEKALKLFGKIDFLFNNGGISQRSLATETSIETDRKIMEINYFSGIILTKKLLPSMIQRGFGHIIATSSLTGKFGLPYRSAYAASKHAVQGYYESVWMEFHNKGIRTTVVFPGAVKTNISIEAIGPGGIAHGKMDDIQAKGISPEKCALDILKGVRKNKREIFTGSKELRGVYIKRFFPGLFYKLIVKTNPM
jgi:dehydrogenase/reductase SDR family member 7B